MLGLKNLLTKGVLSEQNFVQLRKRSEDYRKSVALLANHLTQITAIYENYYSLFEENLSNLAANMIMQGDDVPRFYSEVASAFKCLNNELRLFVQRETSLQKPMLRLNDLFMTDYGVLMETFQQKGKDYLNNEQTVCEMARRYAKLMKTMLTAVDSYKNSFTDVKLIYNADEKIKRYQECLALYRNMQEDVEAIQLKIGELNSSKDVLADSYRILEKQLAHFATSYVSKYLQQLKNFFFSLVDLEKSKIQSFIDRTQNLDRYSLNTYFTASFNQRFKEFLTKQITAKDCLNAPCFALHHELLREEGRWAFKKMMATYYLDMITRAERRKNIGRAVTEYVQKSIKAQEKSIAETLRDAQPAFEKIKKKIGQAFGTQWPNFYRPINALFEHNAQKIGKLLSKMENKVKNLETGINQQASVIQSFLREFKAIVEKAVSKKLLRKYADKEEKQEPFSEEERATTVQQIQDHSDSLLLLISRYRDQLQKLGELIHETLVGLLSDLRLSMSEYYSFACEIKNKYYEEQEYAQTISACEEEISSSSKQQLHFFEELPLAIVTKEQKVSFDSEFHKVEGFKKIKKPRELEEALAPPPVDSGLPDFLPEAESPTIADKSADKNKRQAQRQTFMGDTGSKHAEYLAKRIQLFQNEKYIKSYSCSLADKIILAGRLFITNQRLAFHSKFNPKTVLFGETFIIIPKADIQKIEKRSSVFFDNGISITTVNGEMLFTSFFARNATFDLLIKTYEISQDHLFFVDEEDAGGEEVNLPQTYEDDMQEEDEKEREVKLAAILPTHTYVNVLDVEFEFPGLNIIKFLKIFELDQQITINRTSYPSFTYYFKDINEHKDISIEPWNPNPLDSINAITLKQGCPDVFTRKVSAIIPLPPSNIPFMPKVSLTNEEHTLAVLNRNKFVFDSIVKNQGIPYCDSFDLRMRRTVIVVNQNRLRMSFQVFLNFKEKIMVQSTIEAKTLQTSKSNAQQLADEITSYLKQLEKKMFKAGKKETPEDKIIQQAQLIEELEKELREQKEVNKKQAELLVQSEKKLLPRHIVIGVLFVAVLVQLFLILA